MAIKNLGSFKKTIGKYDMHIGDMVITFDKLKAKDILEFKEVFAQYLDKKKEAMEQFIKKHLIDNKQFEGTDFTDEDIDLFVACNLEELIAEYMIMFRLTTREKLEESKKEAQQQLKRKKNV